MFITWCPNAEDPRPCYRQRKLKSCRPLKKPRSAPACESISGGTIAAVARGVVARTRPSVLHKNEGFLHMGKQWAAYTMKTEDWKPLCRTSDRTIPDEDIARAAQRFSIWCVKLGVAKNLCLILTNLQFFLSQMVLAPTTSRRRCSNSLMQGGVHVWSAD